MKYVAEIVPNGMNGWDIKHGTRICFRSEKRFLYFVRYYSLKHDVLIRAYSDGWWFASYVDGKEIWNAF